MPIYLDLYGNPAIWQPFIVEMLASPEEMIECENAVRLDLVLYGNPNIWLPFVVEMLVYAWHLRF